MKKKKREILNAVRRLPSLHHEGDFTWLNIQKKMAGLNKKESINRNIKQAEALTVKTVITKKKVGLGEIPKSYLYKIGSN
jgi:hypothetical protein